MEPGSDYLNENIKALYLCLKNKNKEMGNFSIFMVSHAKWTCHQSKFWVAVGFFCCCCCCLFFFAFSLIWKRFVIMGIYG